MGSVGNAEIKNPLYSNSSIISEAQEELEKRAKNNSESEVYIDDIFVDRIISPQNYLEKDRLVEDANKGIENIPTVEVIKYKDEYILTDGNHRVVVAKQNNVSKINARVIDLDKKAIRKKRS